MLHNIKCRMFKMIGRNIAECQDAFEDGIAQGKILRQKYREAKEEIKAKEEAKNNPVEPNHTKRASYSLGCSLSFMNIK